MLIGLMLAVALNDLLAPVSSGLPFSFPGVRTYQSQVASDLLEVFAQYFSRQNKSKQVPFNFPPKELVDVKDLLGRHATASDVSNLRSAVLQHIWLRPDFETLDKSLRYKPTPNVADMLLNHPNRHVLVYTGSFNPFHEGHASAIEYGIKEVINRQGEHPLVVVMPSSDAHLENKCQSKPVQLKYLYRSRKKMIEKLRDASKQVPDSKRCLDVDLIVVEDTCPFDSAEVGSEQKRVAIRSFYAFVRRPVIFLKGEDRVDTSEAPSSDTVVVPRPSGGKSSSLVRAQIQEQSEQALEKELIQFFERDDEN